MLAHIPYFPAIGREFGKHQRLCRAGFAHLPQLFVGHPQHIVITPAILSPNTGCIGEHQGGGPVCRQGVIGNSDGFSGGRIQ